MMFWRMVEKEFSDGVFFFFVRGGNSSKERYELDVVVGWLL